MLDNILETLTTWWQIEILRNAVLTLILGNLILGFVIFILGWKIGRFFIHKGVQRYISKRINDPDTGNWLSKFIFFLWFLVVLVSSLVVVGIPASIFSFLWHFSLFTLEGHSVELGNVLLGLILLYPGIRFSRYLSLEFQSIFLTRLNLETASRNLLTVLVRYVLIVFVALFVLTMVGIPLTAFTVIGGALAIGVGLGSQNLVNNFLSGLVLMIERPLKINDVVEVEGRRGTVEHIGGRSTRIRTSDNLRLVIPNSKLLENTVINWSLIDNQIRIDVEVGVAYGSDVEKTAELMKLAILEHPRVLKYPEPIVLFEAFGDNALNFRGIFWTDFDRAIRPRITASEIRFKINALFEAAGIVIAFPQRDVHLNSTSPIDVRVVGETGNQKSRRDG